MAFFDCLTRCFLAFKKLPDLENITPKYLYLSVILIILSPSLNSKLLLFLELDIIISVLLKFISISTFGNNHKIPLSIFENFLYYLTR